MGIELRIEPADAAVPPSTERVLRSPALDIALAIQADDWTALEDMGVPKVRIRQLKASKRRGLYRSKLTHSPEVSPSTVI